MKRPAPEGSRTSPPQSVSTPRMAVAVAASRERSSVMVGFVYNHRLPDRPEGTKSDAQQVDPAKLQANPAPVADAQRRLAQGRHPAVHRRPGGQDLPGDRRLRRPVLRRRAGAHQDRRGPHRPGRPGGRRAREAGGRLRLPHERFLLRDRGAAASLERRGGGLHRRPAHLGAGLPRLRELPEVPEPRRGHPAPRLPAQERGAGHGRGLAPGGRRARPGPGRSLRLGVDRRRLEGHRRPAAAPRPRHLRPRLRPRGGASVRRGANEGGPRFSEAEIARLRFADLKARAGELLGLRKPYHLVKALASR